ncbi:MAG: dihydrolipoamide acetyltransferase family protein [Legionellaceae bacterium]|nr:dihydrolipoamide acetyltransferase family protein [Legionellaceae bacterium]
MSIFHLPDLGEGLPDAEIRQWYVKVGDHIEVDQPLVSMETAKAVVDVPAPQAGTILTLHGAPGDLVKTGSPLVEFRSDQKPVTADAGTVVGSLESLENSKPDTFHVAETQRIQATPAVRHLARRLGVSLQDLKGTGIDGVITREEVEQAAKKSASAHNETLPEGYEALRGVRRAMAHSMSASHAEVVPVTLFDEADISAWPSDTDITVRLIQALIHACQKEPALNAWYNTPHTARKCFDALHLGLAIDGPEGLFVPVIQNAEQLSAQKLRDTIIHYKQAVANRTIDPKTLQGATFTLSNFGKFAGRFATPIIVPPMVAILGVGKRYQSAIVDTQGHIQAHPMLPISLSFDHRAATGGEATRFLQYFMEKLQEK